MVSIRKRASSVDKEAVRLLDEDGRKAILVNPALLECNSYDFIGLLENGPDGTAATATTATAATNLHSAQRLSQNPLLSLLQISKHENWFHRGEPRSDQKAS